MEIILSVVYILILIYTVFRILLDTHSTPKTLAYLLLVLMLPLVGIFIYFSFGINYRHRRHNRKAVAIQGDLDREFNKEIEDRTDSLVVEHRESLNQYAALLAFIRRVGGERITENRIKLLNNGEEKFPEV